MSLAMKVHYKDEGPTDVLRFYTFEKAADEIRVTLVPEIANAIDDAVEDRGEDMNDRVLELTTILAKLCSAADDDVIEGVREWGAIVLERGLGHGWIELIL